MQVPGIVLPPYALDLVHQRIGAATSVQSLTSSQIVVAIARPEDAVAGERGQTLLSLLSGGERERLRRFHFARDRDLFLAAHALVRLTLSQYWDAAPASWQFTPGPYGRPEISAPRCPLRFSLSHTRGLAACAVVCERDVGVDVERIASEAALEAADQFFSAAEARDLRRAGPEHQAGRFFEYWTLKEAYVKARGLGLSLPLDSFSLCRAVGTWRISFRAPAYDDPERWWFESLVVGETHQLALAVGRRSEHT